MAYGPEQVLAEQGFALKIERTMPRTNQLPHVFKFEVGFSNVIAGLSLHCSRHGFLNTLVRRLSLPSRVFKVGDSLFDERVQVKTSNPEAVRTLLSIDGVQSALLSLVCSAEGAMDHVSINQSCLTVMRSLRVPFTEDEKRNILFEALALVIHVRRWGAAGSSASTLGLRV